MNEVKADVPKIVYPNTIYAIVQNGVLTGEWSTEPFERAEKLSIDPDDFIDFNDTEGGIFDAVDGRAIKVRDRDSCLIHKKKRCEALQKVQDFREHLNNDWRWRQERNAYEQKEILLGLREVTSEKEEDLVRERAEIVSEINRLEEEFNI